MRYRARFVRGHAKPRAGWVIGAVESGLPPDKTQARTSPWQLAARGWFQSSLVSGGCRWNWFVCGDWCCGYIGCVKTSKSWSCMHRAHVSWSWARGSCVTSPETLNRRCAVVPLQSRTCSGRAVVVPDISGVRRPLVQLSPRPQPPNGALRLVCTAPTCCTETAARSIGWRDGSFECVVFLLVSR